MSIDWLEELERDIEIGMEVYVAPALGLNEWHFGKTLESILKKAQATANAKRYDACIYRLDCSHNMNSGSVYYVVREILVPTAKADPNLRWCIVDTKEAAEMLRDVSQGPTPYFGAIVVKRCVPEINDDV